MNYYNPYFMPINYGVSTTPSLIKSIFGRGISWSGILSGTQKTLGVVNQAIPLIKQASPIVKNAKTMFKVFNEFKKVDINESKDSFVIPKNNQNEQNIQSNIVSNDNPTFFQ